MMTGALTKIYAGVEEGEIDQAMEILFDYVDDLMDRGDFAACDQLILSTDLTKLNTNLLVGLLSILHVARAELKHYELILVAIEARLEVIAPGRVDRLMSGFK